MLKISGVVRRGEVYITAIISVLSLISALTSADRVDVRSQCVLGLPGYAGSDDLLSGALHLHHSRPGPGSRSL